MCSHDATSFFTQTYCMFIVAIEAPSQGAVSASDPSTFSKSKTMHLIPE